MVNKDIKYAKTFVASRDIEPLCLILQKQLRSMPVHRPPLFKGMSWTVALCERVAVYFCRKSNQTVAIRRRWLLLCFYVMFQPAQSQLNLQVPSDISSTTIRWPRAGEKLGYSKARSEKVLPDDVKKFLDGVMKTYYEPGVFTNRALAVTTLGAALEDRQRRRPTERPTLP